MVNSMEDEKRILNASYNFVIAILSFGEPTVDAMYDLFELRIGNKELLLDHLNAISSIMGKAIKILEGKQDGDESN